MIEFTAVTEIKEVRQNIVIDGVVVGTIWPYDEEKFQCAITKLPTLGLGDGGLHGIGVGKLGAIYDAIVSTEELIQRKIEACEYLRQAFLEDNA